MALGIVVIVITGTLIVNFFKDKKGETLPDLSTQVNSKEYTVNKGDTLWSISESTYGSGYNWTDIYKANGLSTEKIEVGQKLTLPDVSAKEPTSTTVTENLETSEKTSYTGETYTVVKGDNLWKIAVNTYGDGYMWLEIAKADKLDNPSIIHAGNVLTLPR